MDGLGLRTVLDLRLLGGGREAGEMMDELRTAGMSLGDRAKIRLLTGDQAHLLSRLSASGDAASAAVNGHADASSRRRLQDAAAAESSGMSIDTIAIVLTVLVGTAGYIVQACTARRAEQSTAEEAAQLHIHETARQREHETMTAQVHPCDTKLLLSSRHVASNSKCVGGDLDHPD